jgi:hypothetical protein
MATRYWVGGSGNWDTTTTTNWSTSTGGTGGASAPTSADDVIFDANSNIGTTIFTVAIPGTANCNNFSTGGAGGALDAVMTLSLPSAGLSVFNVYGSLTLPATNFTWTGTSSGLNFLSSNTGNTITTNGVTLVSTVITWNNVNGGWTLGSALTNSNNTCQFSAGSLNTGNYNISLTQLNMSGAGARTLTLGSSTVTLPGAAPWTYSGSNLTLNAGTSTINCSAATATFTGGGLTYYNVGFTSGGLTAITITGANTFNNLTITPRTTVGNNLVSISANQTVNGTLTVASSILLGATRCTIRSSVLGTSRTIVANAVSLTDVDFRDINNTGVTWTGTRLGDCGGNSGITFSTAKTVYWNLTGSQNYSATGWATTQTGTPATTNFPLPQDTAIFTNTAPIAGSTITLNVAYNIGVLDFSIRSNTLTFATGIIAPTIFGNITLSSAITLSGTGILTFSGRNVTQTLTSAGKTFTQPISQTTIGGGITFADAYSSTNTYTLTNGLLSSNYNITVTSFNSSNSNVRSLTLGSGTFTLTSTSTIWDITTSTNFTITSGTSKIALTDTSTTARTFAGGNLTYNNLEIGGATGISTLTITGSNTFNIISSTKTVAHTILFTAGTTTTVADWTVTGTAGNVVTINSVTAAGHNLVKTGGGNISIDYMNITWSNASP